MKTKNELIHSLVEVVRAGAGREDCLYLPDWDDEVWKRMLLGAEVMETRNGEVLLERNDGSHDLYFVVEGRLEVATPQSDGVTLTAPVGRGPGSIVGEIAFLDGGTRTASVWSHGDAILLRLSEAAFHEFRSAEPDLACDVLCAIGRIVAERLRRCIGAA